MPGQGGSWKKAPKRGPRKKEWVASSKPTGFSRKQQHQLTVAFLLFVSLSLIALFVYVLTRKKDPLPLLAIAVTEYSEHVPPNALALEDIQRFNSVLGKSYNNIELIVPTEATPGGRDDFVRVLAEQMALKEFRPGGPKKDTVAVYISAHGVTDQRGDPCLLLAGSQPNDSETWLPISKLLEPFAALDKSVKKILFLESGKIESNWMLGQIYNGFADQLESTVESADIENLSVIASHSPGERSFTSLKKGGSIFGDVVARSLRGAGMSDSGDIDLHSCANEIRRSVRAWSLSNRARPQTPRLLPSDAPNFKIAEVTDFDATESADQSIPFASRTERVKNLWNDYSVLQQSAPYKSDPINWSRIQHKLVYLQKAAVAGQAYEDAFQNTATDIDGIMSQLRSFSKITPFPASTIALTNHLRQPDQEKLKNAKTVWEAWKNPPEGKERTPLKPENKLDYLIAANVVWNELVASPNVNKTQIETALEFLQVQAKAVQIDAAEIHFLRLIANWVDWPVAQVGPFVSLRNKYFGIEVPKDFRSHYRLNAFFQGKFGGQFRTTEDRLFYSSNPQRLDKMTAHLSGELAKAKELSDELSEAYLVRDRIWATVPFFAKWTLSRHVQFDDGDRDKTVEDLDKLLESNRRLDDLIRRGLSKEDTLMQEESLALRKLTTSIKQAEEAVAARFRSRVQEVTSGDIRMKFAEMGEVIENPLLSPKSRRDLFQGYVTFLNSDSKPTDQDEKDDPNSETQQFAEWLTTESNGAIAATLPLRVLNIEAPPTTAQTHRERVLEIAKLGGDIRSRMSQLGEKFEADAALHARELKKGESLAIDRGPLELGCADLRQVVPVSSAHAWNAETNNPVANLHLVDTYGYLLWQGEQRRLDAWGSGRTGNATAFFYDSVKEHIKASKSFDPDGVIERDYAKVLSAKNNNFMNEFEPKQSIQQKLPTLIAKDVVLSPSEDFADHAMQLLKLSDEQEGSATIFVKGGLDQIELQASRNSSAKIRRLGSKVNRTRELEYVIAATDIKQNSQFHATLFYRGHIRQRAFFGERPNGEFIAIPRLQPAPTRIQVTQKILPYEIVFVLDCSASMQRKIPSGKTMMQAAKESLKNEINKLLIRNQDTQTEFHVAVVAYGHRWTRRAVVKGKVANAPRLNPKFPNAPKLLPIEDVQTIAKMELLTQNHYDDIAREINRLDWWGETPLHYAVQQAIRHSFSEDYDGRRDIIVITDGGNTNDIMNVNGRQPKQVQNKLLRDIDFVERVLADPGGRFQQDDSLHLQYVFYKQGMNDQFDEKLESFKTTLDTFKTPRNQTNDRVTYFPADSASLAAYINKVLQPNFVVEGIGSDYQAEGQVDTDGITIDNLRIEPASADNFKVKIVGETNVGSARSMLLRGGELVSLEYDPVRRELSFPPYLQRIDNTVRPETTDSEFRINAHVIDRVGASATFKISVQQADTTKFSVRPNAIWAEIRPIFDGSKAEEDKAYYLYDVRFDSDAWAPLFLLTVGNWPDRAELAEVRFWFSFRGDPPVTTFPINTTEANVRIPDKPFDGGRLRFEEKQVGNAFQLIVRELHDAKDSFPLWVAVDHEPDTINRFFLGQSSTVSHSFNYNDARGTVGRTINLRIARQKDFLSQWHEVRPFVIRVDARR